jgi:hypothetical protein
VGAPASFSSAVNWFLFPSLKGPSKNAITWALALAGNAHFQQVQLSGAAK